MLRITKQTDYGIVLLTIFALDEDRSVHNARDLAAQAGLPLPTASKILKALGRASMLESHRGVKGGYSLARDPREISVEEIIVALEGPIAITECLDQAADDCDIQSTCPVRTNWQLINGAVQGALRGISLHQMASTVAFKLPPSQAAAEETRVG